MSKKVFFIPEKLVEKLESGGYIAGKKWDTSFDTAEELKEHVMTYFYYESVVKDLEMDDELWEEAFKIWKASELRGTCDAEDFR